MTMDCCEVCGLVVPEWPAGWLFTDDDRAFCLEHKGDRRFRSRTIWKYELDLTDVQKVTMPKGTELLHADRQGDDICLWASVDPAAPTVDRLIAIVGTGHPAPEPTEAKFVGTVLAAPFVWHVYDVGDE